jgi:O-antigen ligase
MEELRKLNGELLCKLYFFSILLDGLNKEESYGWGKWHLWRNQGVHYFGNVYVSGKKTLKLI